MVKGTVIPCDLLLERRGESKTFFFRSFSQPRSISFVHQAEMHNNIQSPPPLYAHYGNIGGGGGGSHTSSGRRRID
jgi:hypothetical protein